MGVLGGERWGPLGGDRLLLSSGVLSLEKLSLSVVCGVMGGGKQMEYLSTHVPPPRE